MATYVRLYFSPFDKEVVVDDAYRARRSAIYKTSLTPAGKDAYRRAFNLLENASRRYHWRPGIRKKAGQYMKELFLASKLREPKLEGRTLATAQRCFAQACLEEELDAQDLIGQKAAWYPQAVKAAQDYMEKEGD